MSEWAKSSYCSTNACVEVQFRKSTRSATGACVEVGLQPETDAILVRDSKDPDGAVLHFTRDEWRAFIAGAKAGEFDDF